MDLKIEEMLKFIRALAYLPEEEIPVALIKIIRREEDENIFKRTRRFFKYLIDQWLIKRKPEEWSVFNCIRKTNNASESFNRSLNANFGRRPEIWQFTSNINILSHF